MLHGLMSSVAGLFSARLALGLAEAPCFPANSRILSTWFPQTERARANSVYAVGQYVGLGFMIPVLTYIVATLRLARAVLHLRRHRHRVRVRLARAVPRAARERARESGGARPHRRRRRARRARRRGSLELGGRAALLRQRQILGASIGQFCGNSTLVFFLTWFPSYLATERGMDWIQSGFAASLAVHRAPRSACWSAARSPTASSAARARRRSGASCRSSRACCSRRRWCSRTSRRATRSSSRSCRWRSSARGW